MSKLYNNKDLLMFEVKDVKRELAYLGKINGTVFGWFIGFGKDDEYNLVKQELFYRNKKVWNKFPIELNFGRTEIDQNKVKKHFHS